jgi:hypothetical protein
MLSIRETASEGSLFISFSAYFLSSIRYDAIALQPFSDLLPGHGRFGASLGDDCQVMKIFDELFVPVYR